MSSGLPAPPQLIAHRGGAGLAPENTLAAFLDAVERWQADLIELDVRLTADGRCVVIHDARVDRTTDGTGDVASLPFAAIRELDAGYSFTPDGGATHPFRGRAVRVPAFDEVLDAVPPHTPLIVEIKTVEAQRPTLESIRRCGAEHRVIPASERAACLRLFRDYPGATSAPLEDIRRFYIQHRLHLAHWARPHFRTCQLPERYGTLRLITPRFVHDLHRHGVQLSVWTVNDPSDMDRLLDWGVDGLITDRPDVLAKLLVERSGRPPPPGLDRPVAPSERE